MCILGKYYYSIWTQYLNASTFPAFVLMDAKCNRLDNFNIFDCLRTLISSKSQAWRKTADYVSAIIEKSTGTYVFS